VNRDKTNAKELTVNNVVDVRKLRHKGSELDILTSVGDLDNLMNADKENVNAVDRASVASGQLQSTRVEHSAALNAGLRDRTAESVDEIDESSRYDAADVKMCLRSAKRQQRKTFSLGTMNLPAYSAVQSLPMQSDSIDVVNVIGEVADMFQGSSQLSDADTDDDFSTQDIEAHEEGNFSGFQHSAANNAVMPVVQHAVRDTSLPLHSVNNITAGPIDVSQHVELTVEPQTAILAVSTAANCSQVSHGVPVLEGLPVKALQYVPLRQVQEAEDVGNEINQLEAQLEQDSGNLVETKISDEGNVVGCDDMLPEANKGVDRNETAVCSLPLTCDVRNNSLSLLANGLRSEDMVSVTVDEQLQVKSSPAAAAADVEMLSESAAEGRSHGQADIEDTDAVDKTSGTKQQSVHSAELLSSQADNDTSDDDDDDDDDDDSKSGELRT